MTEHPGDYDPEADIPTRRRSDLHRPPQPAPVAPAAPMAPAAGAAAISSPTIEPDPNAGGGPGIPPNEPAPRDRGWWERNKWGLILLPVAIIVAVAASSWAMVTFWYGDGPHDVTAAKVGESVDFRQDWQDFNGKHTREVTVTVTGIAPTTVVENYDGEDEEAVTPGGTTLWRVSMDLSADPEQILVGCHVDVIDTEGREFSFESIHIKKPLVAKVSPCLNAGERGPDWKLTEGQKPSEPEPRPEKWSTVADVLMAEDSVPARVRIWWETPKAIEVPISPTS